MAIKLVVAFAAAWCLAGTAIADTRPDSHAPIGVMGDHYHAAGEWMFSYRFMHMNMEGNRDATSRVSSQSIVTTEPNRFFGLPMQPPTLRIVPTEMSMDMHMFGAMFAPTDRLTLMGMVNYLSTEMEHLTFMGGAGTTLAGTFTTRTAGFGDTTLGALIRLNDSPTQRWHLTAAMSLPTGNIKARDNILTPMGGRPRVRLPYPMQLGSGTYDLVTGLTYAGHDGAWGWGSQWRSLWRLGENGEDYTLGDRHDLSGWLSYQLNPSLSLSGRLAYRHQGNIDGQDPAIRGPVQTADPERQKSRRLDVGVGLNWLLPGAKQRLGLELLTPLWQNFYGPQLETDWQITLGWQIAL